MMAYLGIMPLQHFNSCGNMTNAQFIAECVYAHDPWSQASDQALGGWQSWRVLLCVSTFAHEDMGAPYWITDYIMMHYTMIAIQ